MYPKWLCWKEGLWKLQEISVRNISIETDRSHLVKFFHVSLSKCSGPDTSQRQTEGQTWPYKAFFTLKIIQNNVFVRECKQKISKWVIYNGKWYLVLSEVISVLHLHSDNVWELFLSRNNNRYKFGEWLWTSTKFNRLYLGYSFTYELFVGVCACACERACVCVCVLIHSSRTTLVPHHDNN
jgi:hypothetical protein